MRLLLIAITSLLLSACASQGQVDPHGYHAEGQASY